MIYAYDLVFVIVYFFQQNHILNPLLICLKIHYFFQLKSNYC